MPAGWLKNLNNLLGQEDMELLTLREEQLQDAREAATDILQNKQPNEALIIFILFTEGLLPVRSVREREGLKQGEAHQLRSLRDRIHTCCSPPFAIAAAATGGENNDDLSPSPHQRGSVFQVTDNKRAGKTMMGIACINFSENLSDHPSCAPGFSQHVAVDLRFSARKDGNLVTSEMCRGILNMLTWRLDVKWGKMEFAEKVFEKSPERDAIDWNASLSGAVKNGRVDDALELFWAKTERNVVSWTTMNTGHAQKDCMDKALMAGRKQRICSSFSPDLLAEVPLLVQPDNYPELKSPLCNCSMGLKVKVCAFCKQSY